MEAAAAQRAEEVRKRQEFMQETKKVQAHQAFVVLHAESAAA